MKRNILFITADQMRWDCLGHWGKFPSKTPNIDRLIQEGTIFEQAYCASPLCVPSRASIMTGLHPFRTGVYYNDQPWADNVATLPADLSANGYYTVAVGKMHFIPKRRHAGFDKMLNESELADHFRKKNTSRPKGSKDASAKASLPWDEMIVKHYSKRWDETANQEEYEPVFHTNNAINELERLVSHRDCTGDAHEPFFMWLSMLRPHSPCCPPPPYSGWYRAEDMPPPVKTEQEKQAFAKPLKEFARGWEAISDELIADFRARYLGDVSVVDHQIGRVLESLVRLGLRENTLIIVSSDHGEYLGDHHMLQKSFFHDASSKVPLIFSGPEVEQGHAVTQNVSLVDLRTTLLDYCGLLTPSLKDEQGRSLYLNDDSNEDATSLLPALSGKELSDERIVLAETAIYGQGIMAKIGNLKYNYYPQTGEFDLFDLSLDPDELHNQGSSLTFGTLPVPVRVAFERVLARTELMRERSYCFEGKIRPMFT